MRQVLSDLGIKQTVATLVFEDNQSAICMSKNPQFHGRAKHVDVKYHFVREQVTKRNIELKYCRTEDMIADMFTKGLSHAKFTKLRHMAGVVQEENNLLASEECWDFTLSASCSRSFKECVCFVSGTRRLFRS